MKEVALGVIAWAKENPLLVYGIVVSLIWAVAK